MKQLTKALLSRAARNQCFLKVFDRTLARVDRYISENRRGPYYPLFDRFTAYTRLPRAAFCKNLALVEKYCSVQGDIVECGVWRGGMSAGMACILGENREYHLFDSFEGLPEATAIDGERALAWQAHNDVDSCRTEEHYAHAAMTLAGVQRFHVYKGWFNQTLPGFRPRNRIAVLRLDADWYSSTAECLNALYAQVVPGGLIILDDYYAWDGCSRAIHDFLSVNKLADRIHEYAGSVCYLRKVTDRSVRAIEPEGREAEEGS
jgi:O-methyltransferase